MIRRMKQWLVVGLGNPGSRYKKTRHNLGMRVLRDWARAYGEEAAGNVITFFPVTAINETGRAVAATVRAHAIKPEHIIILHDDVELALGEMRFKEGGSAAGHRGVKSIQAALQTQAIARLRLGIGKPAGVDLTGYVLQPFTPEEEAQLPAILTAAAQELQRRLYPE